MKIIGEITPDWQGDEGQASNGLYLGGSIVMLSKHEMRSLEMIQSAIKGDNYEWLNLDNMRSRIDTDIAMDSVFLLVLEFANAKFMINEFKKGINHLDNLIMKGENEL